MAKMAQEQSGGKEPEEIVKTENKTKETKLAKVQPQVSFIEINIAKTHCQKCGHKKVPNTSGYIFMFKFFSRYLRLPGLI